MKREYSDEYLLNEDTEENKKVGIVKNGISYPIKVREFPNNISDTLYLLYPKETLNLLEFDHPKFYKVAKKNGSDIGYIYKELVFIEKGDLRE